MTVSLLTNGWICYARRTIVRRYVLPLDISIKESQGVNLNIIDKQSLDFNINQILNKNVNLTLTDKNINIKRLNKINIGVNKCSQDS